MLPIRYRLRALGEWVAGVTGLAVLQADQGTHRPALPYVGLSRLPGAWDAGLPRREVRLGVETTWTLDFAAVVDTDFAGVVIDGRRVEVFGFSAGVARDEWLDAFAATWIGADGWITAVASGAEAVALATGSGWVPPVVTAGRQVTVSADSTADLEIWRTPTEIRYRLQVYGSEYPEAVLAAIRREAQRDPPPGLRSIGVPTVTSIQSGGNREVRGWVDLRIGLDDLSASAASGLASVEYSLPLI